VNEMVANQGTQNQVYGIEVNGVGSDCLFQPKTVDKSFSCRLTFYFLGGNVGSESHVVTCRLACQHLVPPFPPPLLTFVNKRVLYSIRAVML